MRAFLIATIVLAALGFGRDAVACNAIEKVTADQPEHVFKSEDCLWSSDSRFFMYMHKDGTLDVRDKRNPGQAPIWTAKLSGPAQPGSTAVLRNDGSFVVLDPAGNQLWAAAVRKSLTAPAGYKGDFYIAFNKKGRLEIYKGKDLSDPSRDLVWYASDLHDDTDGQCQCHVTNMDGSPGKAKDDPFGACGLDACRSTCAAKKDYFGDKLIGTYSGGGGKCRAF
jgi:hypothetical protein